MKGAAYCENTIAHKSRLKKCPLIVYDYWAFGNKMIKDFKKWSVLKQEIESSKRPLFCNTREIWWCSFGLNIGTELDGKNDVFERPVLILKVFSRESIRVIPLSSATTPSKHSYPIDYDDKEGSVLLSQIKTLSTKRLTRKMCRLSKAQFIEIVEAIRREIA